MSRAVLAASLKMTFQQIAKYEAAENRMPASKLYKAALALETPIETFFPPQT